jgi:hypothetical protein
VACKLPLPGQACLVSKQKKYIRNHMFACLHNPLVHSLQTHATDAFPSDVSVVEYDQRTSEQTCMMCKLNHRYGNQMEPNHQQHLLRHWHAVNAEAQGQF